MISWTSTHDVQLPLVQQDAVDPDLQAGVDHLTRLGRRFLARGDVTPQTMALSTPSSILKSMEYMSPPGSVFQSLFHIPGGNRKISA